MEKWFKNYEKTLGIPLQIFLTALRSGIWYIGDINIRKDRHKVTPIFIHKDFETNEKVKEGIWYFKFRANKPNGHKKDVWVKVSNYGKDYALTKKELRYYMQKQYEEKGE